MTSRMFSLGCLLIALLPLSTRAQTVSATAAPVTVSPEPLRVEVTVTRMGQDPKVLSKSTLWVAAWQDGLSDLGSSHTSSFKRLNDGVEGTVKEIDRPQYPAHTQIVSQSKTFINKHIIRNNATDEDIGVGLYNVETRLTAFSIGNQMYIRGDIGEDLGINRHAYEGVDVEVPNVNLFSISLTGPLGEKTMKEFEENGSFYRISVVPLN